MRIAHLCGFLVVLFLSTQLSGCCGSCVGGKDSLDATTDALVKALQDKDYDAFKALSKPSLVDEVSPDVFNGFATLIGQLGPMSDRTMNSFNFENTLIKGGYVLTFEEGPVDFSLSVVDDKLVAFNFSGDTIKRVSKEGPSSTADPKDSTKKASKKRSPKKKAPKKTRTAETKE